MNKMLEQNWSGGGEFLTRTPERHSAVGETVIKLLFCISIFHGTGKPVPYDKSK